MPIYEYRCKACDHAFETLLQGKQRAACPKCGGRSLEKQLSVFATASSDSGPSGGGMGPCGTCGDPRGPGSCSMN